MSLKSGQVLLLITSPYQVILFVMMEQRTPMAVLVSTSEKFSYIKWNGLNISLDNNLESTFIEVNLSKKNNFICGCIYKHPNMPTKYLTPLLEKLNREDKICFLMGDFNINLMKINSESDNSQFYNTMCSYFFMPLVLQPTRVTDKSKTQY